MTLPLFFADPGSLADAEVGATVTLAGDEGRHAVTVKRIQIGEGVLLADGSGIVALCTTAETRGKNTIDLTIKSLAEADSRSSLVVILALIKGERMERAVEQLTEVGVGTVIPWASERSVISLKGDAATKIHKRLERKAFEAAKQCRQPTVPSVKNPMSSDEIKAYLTELAAESDLGQVIVLHEEATDSLADTPSGASVLIVGPEGGLTEGEIAAFEQLGATTRLMGRNVMRAGTAAVVGAAWLLGSSGHWNNK